MPNTSTEQANRFFDGGADSVPVVPVTQELRGASPRISLARVFENKAESFRLLRRLGYDDTQFGQILVPADLETWPTDLTSVPAWFTWLVPKTGAHLPAALIHDGLIWDPKKETQSYVCDHEINRVDANRVMRDAMRDTGTGRARRWLVWAALAAKTMVDGRGTGWSRALHLRYAATVVLTVGLIAYLGYCATGDLFDREPWLSISLPWMGNRLYADGDAPFLVELVGGLSGAVIVPLLLGPLWGRFIRAGWVTGIAFAVLIHVTAAVALVSLGYQLTERLVTGKPTLALAAGVLTLMSAVLVFGIFLLS